MLSRVIRELHGIKLNKSISTEISHASQARVNNSSKYGLASRCDIPHFHATLEDFHIPISSARTMATRYHRRIPTESIAVYLKEISRNAVIRLFIIQRIISSSSAATELNRCLNQGASLSPLCPSCAFSNARQATSLRLAEYSRGAIIIPRIPARDRLRISRCRIRWPRRSRSSG